MIKIRKGTAADIDEIMSCYDTARDFMRLTGNLNQWINGYPSRKIIERDIEKGDNYVGVDDDGDIVMAFAFITGNDPTYYIIEQGQWLNDLPYGTIHRLGSTGKHKGILQSCVEYCLTKIDNLRLDTHEDNKVMQTAAERLGFKRCGIIYCDDGTPRIAYQKYL